MVVIVRKFHFKFMVERGLNKMSVCMSVCINPSIVPTLLNQQQMCTKLVSTMYCEHICMLEKGVVSSICLKINPILLTLQKIRFSILYEVASTIFLYSGLNCISFRPKTNSHEICPSHSFI